MVALSVVCRRRRGAGAGTAGDADLHLHRHHSLQGLRMFVIMGGRGHVGSAVVEELRSESRPVTVRERLVASLRNASEALAAKIAEGLNMSLPDAMPRAMPKPPKPEVQALPSLSLTARPGDGSIAGTRSSSWWPLTSIAGPSVASIQLFLRRALRDDSRHLESGRSRPPLARRVQADVSLENEPGFLLDALVVNVKLPSCSASPSQRSTANGDGNGRITDAGSARQLTGATHLTSSPSFD